MNFYAGIGSRRITPAEVDAIITKASRLADLGWTLSTGGAIGSDTAFQRGSGGDCVLWRPDGKWFPARDLSHKAISTQPSTEAMSSVPLHHGNPSRLDAYGWRIMARNWHQVMGGIVDGVVWPRVSFVLAMADRTTDGGIAGGTGQACRIAVASGIPVYCMRSPTDMAAFEQRLETWIMRRDAARNGSSSAGR